jgi:hydroxymethylglutaryl-CoA lyase
MQLPSHVKLVEVSPRDGLQNESSLIPLNIKLELIQRLAASGLTTIEATSFVSPKWVPQLADHAELFAALPKIEGISYPVLIPNIMGLTSALSVGVKEIAVFAAASETFSQKNINASIQESLARFAPVIVTAKEYGLRIRAYVSCVLGCPYEGKINPNKVLEVADVLYQMGCEEISLGDTIGVGTPLATGQLIRTVNKKIPLNALAMHFHDTYGQALANIYTSLQEGIATIDASVAGLGGCPYAPGAAGNVATEDVLYMLNGLGIETGVDINTLAKTGVWISDFLGHTSRSKAGLAIVRLCEER